MRYIKPFNEAKKWTLDELFDAMKHPFLEKIFPDGYNTISNDKDTKNIN